MMGEKINCYFCGKELQSEDEVLSVLGEDSCESCQSELQTILDEDVRIGKLNNKYANTGMWRFLLGFVSLADVLLMHQTLDKSWSDWLGVFCIVTFPVCMIGYIFCAIRRGYLKKKIKHELLMEYGIRTGSIHHVYSVREK